MLILEQLAIIGYNLVVTLSISWTTFNYSKHLQIHGH